MSPPTLLTHFLSISCGVSAAESTLLWHCLSLEQRARLRYQIERVTSRRPGGLAGDTEAMRLVQALDPRALVEALEAAAQNGRVTRGKPRGFRTLCCRRWTRAASGNEW